MIAIAVTLLSGVLFYLSQGMADLWPLAWVAPAPLLWLAYGATKRRWVFLATVAAFALGQAYLFQCYLSFIPLFLLCAQVLIMALLFGAAVLFAPWIHARLGAFAALIAFPACWTAIEYLLHSVSSNGTFAALGYSQVSAPVLIQSASLFGLYAITFLLCLCGNAIALALRGGPGARVAAAVGLAVCLANGVYGAIRLREHASDTVRAAVFGDESGMVAAWNAKTRDGETKIASTYAAAIRDAAAHGDKLAVTPEGGVIADPKWEDAVLAPFRAAAKDAHIEIVVGVVERDPAADIAVTFHSNGSIQRYSKRHLVPGLENDFVPGKAPGVLGDQRSVVICKDMDFPSTIRRDAQSGIRVMAVPAGDFVDDAWIHARMAILRGVENGFAVVRAANKGLLTISDAQGRVLARHDYQREGLYSAIADVPLGPGPTLYTQIGDVLAWIAVAASLVLGAMACSAGWRR